MTCIIQLSRTMETTRTLTNTLEKTRKEKRDLQKAMKGVENKNKKYERAQQKGHGNFQSPRSVSDECRHLAEVERLYEEERDHNEV